MIRVNFTDEQYEIAARNLCKRRGKDPDESDWSDISSIFPFGTPTPNWVAAKAELVDFITKAEVLEEVFVQMEEELADAASET